jgi:hypothetical protein
MQSSVVKCSAALVALSVSTLFSTPAVAVSIKPQPTCSWQHPGVDPYMGSVPNAVDTFKDIPFAVRARLKARMAKQEYEDFVVIRRASISGVSEYTNLRDMHFGDRGRVCANVDRSMWNTAHEERGLVYCEGLHCVLVPTVCRNVSRVDRVPVPVAVQITDPAPGVPGLADVLTATPEAPAVGLDTPATTFTGSSANSGLTSTEADSAVLIGSAPWGSFAGPGSAPFGPVGSVGGYVPPATSPGVGVVPAVPEPSTWALLLCGLLLMGGTSHLRAKDKEPGK